MRGGVRVRACAKRQRASPTGERGERKKGEGGLGSGELSAESWGVFKKNKRQKGTTPYIIGGSRAFCCPLV